MGQVVRELESSAGWVHPYECSDSSIIISTISNRDWSVAKRADSQNSYLAGVGTTSLGGALVMGAPILDTNFGVCPFTISMMPG